MPFLHYELPCIIEVNDPKGYEKRVGGLETLWAEGSCGRMVNVSG